MSIPISQFIPPPPPCHFPPLVSIHLFSTSVSLFLPCKPLCQYHFRSLLVKGKKLQSPPSLSSSEISRRDPGLHQPCLPGPCFPLQHLQEGERGWVWRFWVLPTMLSSSPVIVWVFLPPRHHPNPSFLPSFFLLFWPHRASCRILVPPPGLNPGPRQWELGVLTTGPPGNSQFLCVLSLSHCQPASQSEHRPYGLDALTETLPLPSILETLRQKVSVLFLRLALKAFIFSQGQIEAQG